MLGSSNTGLSGHNFDAFVSSHQARDEKDWAAKVQEKYWLARQKFLSKIEKKEDSCLVLSDSKLDAKLEVFRSINKSCARMVDILENYLNCLFVYANEENAFGSMMREFSKVDPTKAGKVMQLTSKSLIQSSHQAIKLYMPLLRFHQEFETFYSHACDDTRETVDKLETKRDQYRASLLWMRDVSEKLDPDVYRRLNKFRLVQNQVRKDKKQFDSLKMDIVQKVDLLMASKCNLVNHVLATYQQTMLKMFAKNLELFEGVKGIIEQQNIDAECIPSFLRPPTTDAEPAEKPTTSAESDGGVERAVEATDELSTGKLGDATETSSAIVDQPTSNLVGGDVLIDVDAEQQQSSSDHNNPMSFKLSSYNADLLNQVKSTSQKMMLLDLDPANPDHDDEEQVIANLLAPSIKLAAAFKQPAAGDLLGLDSEPVQATSESKPSCSYSTMLADDQRKVDCLGDGDQIFSFKKPAVTKNTTTNNLIDIGADDDDYILKQLDLINDHGDNSSKS